MLLYESERFGQDHYLEYSVHEDFSFPVHLHRSLECTVVTEGALQVRVAERNYLLKRGEAMFCLPNEVHGYDGGRCQMASVVFSPEWVPDFMGLMDKKRPVAPVFQLDAAPFSLELFTRLGEPPGDGITAKGILYLLCGAFLAQVQLAQAPERTGDGKLLRQIIQQVQDHFDNPEFSLKTAARNLGYDYCYLSRYTARVLQMPFGRYLAQYRVACAQELLRSGGLTVTEVAARSGFSSIRCFNDTFKRIAGTTPSAVRTRRRNES